ncbi:hypothetical protein BDQ94DRAFT_139080 [Aspergillus welwitschiae]|uniref:Uncharacterized protein n=1 Tax=Aspergillus welwitschiae TaxID=1341132 RepID=A0A3F3Q982_9EURO|nr:hypothetical protein BDQ94DRAFT_139080 [Aspergillus welwitschiae]RDH35713.1 hypothetical protein BDQ94DRAFT_139080 [Aspergillus welwitschiae]
MRRYNKKNKKEVTTYQVMKSEALSCVALAQIARMRGRLGRQRNQELERTRDNSGEVEKR